MKVLHTYIDSNNVLWKELAYSQLYSSFLAKKHYGNISFYSTPKLIKLVKELGFFYDEYIDDVVTEADFSTWSIPKLKVFREQTSSFLHIDYDTFIFNKIDFSSYNSPILFSHLDMQTKNPKLDIGTGISNFINTLYQVEDKKKSFFGDINHTYLRLFFKLFEVLPSGVLENFDLGSIPNMNIVYVEDPELFNSAVNDSLTHFYEYKDIIDDEEFGPCYIEQLMIHQLLRTKSKDYKKLSNKTKHVMFSKLPFYIKDTCNNVPVVDNVTFPYKAKLIKKCKCCKGESKFNLTLDSIDSVKDILNYDFGDFLHLSYMKWYDIYQAFIIHQLRKELGDESVVRIHQVLKQPYKDFNLPAKSPGEILYEKLTNFSFDKVGSYKNNSYI